MPDFKKEYFPKNGEFLSIIEEKLVKGSLSKVNELLEENLNYLSDFELLILRDLFYTYNGEYEESIKLTRTIIEKYPDDYVGYLFQSITFFLMGEFSNALEVIDLGLEKSFNPLLMSQKVQILINSNHDKAFEVIDGVIEDYPDSFVLKRTKFLCDMTDKECCMKSIDVQLNQINDLLESNPDDVDLSILSKEYKKDEGIIIGLKNQ